MPSIPERKQERGNLVAAMRALQAKAASENRDLTADEDAEWSRLDKAQDAIGSAIAREERMAAIDAALHQTSDSGLRPQPNPSPNLVEDRAIANPRAHEAYKKVFRSYLLDGPAAILTMPEHERRALQMDVVTKGGALVAPEEFVATLLRAVDDLVFIRQFATKYTVTMAGALGVPTLDADPADADWTSELQTGSETDMTFGKRELRPHPLAKRIKVSNKLLRASALQPESLVASRLAYKFAITEEKAFLTGTGAQQPLGVFTASADGIPTSRDVSTGNTQTALTADGLIEAKYTLKGPYWPRARWIWSRTAVKNIRKLKDGNGQYLWAPGLTGGTPDTILDMPYSVSEYVPATFTNGLYVGILGDFSQYWIVDALDMTVQRLVELYAETNQTGFIGRTEVDGAPVMAEAFVRVQLAP
jgi:HK97 family phage major capsid protein